MTLGWQPAYLMPENEKKIDKYRTFYFLSVQKQRKAQNGVKK
jgi:hypothetical protein